MSKQEAEQKFRQATALYREKRFAEALQLLDELDGEQPFNQNVMYPRALCLAALGRPNDAVQVCEMLEGMFADPRASELKARILGSAKPAASSGAAAPAKNRPKAAGRGLGSSFPFSARSVVIAVAVVGVCALGIFAFTHRQPAESGSKKIGEREKVADAGTGPSAQEEIDKAMRRHMETSPDPPFTTLYDTGSGAKEPLTTGELTSQTGWTAVEEGKTDHAFKGDAVLMNNQVMVVLRKDGAGAEICGRSAGFQKPYATVVPMGTSSPAQGIDSVAITKCEQDEVILEATHRTATAEKLKVRYELAMGQVSLKVSPVEGATKLRVDAPNRFTVLPDFFADDIVVDAKEVRGARAELPSENFLLHLRGDGEAIVMAVWDKREQDVQIVMDTQSGDQQIQSSEIAFAKDGSIWVALLAAKGIWHMRDIKADEKGKELALGWQGPYSALWRVDWRRSDKLTDSWEMLTEISPGHFKKHGLFEEEEDSWTAQDWWGSGARTRIASGLGRFHYPCWVDQKGQGWLEPLLTESFGFYQPLKGTPSFQGPALIYPLNRLSDTPLDKFTVVDIVRSSLGVGPCQYILDVEGQHEAFEGKPTCTVKEILDEIYESGQQKTRRADVEKALEDVVAFIGLIRGRIDKYQAFSKDTQQFLDDYQKKNPDLAPYIQEMATLTRKIDEAIAERGDSIKSVKFASDLAKKFRSELLDYEGPDAATKCKEFTDAWVDIGGNQDTLVAECRVAVKMLRQTPASSLTENTQRAELVSEIRTRTENILRAPVNYEAPRH